jgi:hypothetical protein
MAWLDGYNKRIKLTIDHTLIGAELSDFPIYRAVTEPEFFSDMLPTDYEYSNDVFVDVGGSFGDDFTGTSIPNTFLWYRPTGYSSTSLRIQDNTLEYDQSNGSHSLRVSKLESLFKLVGDFDIQSDFEVLSTGTPGSGMNTASFVMQDAVTGDRAIVGMSVRVAYPNVRWFMDDTVNGYTDISADGKPTVLKHRIVRVGSVIKGYIWDTDTNQWVWDGDTDGYTFGITGTNDVLVRFEIFVSNLSVTFGGAWDNFKINTGTPTWDTVQSPSANLFEKNIAITGADGTTEQYVEIDYSDLANDNFGIHSKVPVVSADDDTDLYLYWDSRHYVGDNPMVGNTGEAPAQNVWDDDFYGVWHLTELNDSNKVSDSTSNSRDLTEINMDDTDFIETHPGKGVELNGINEFMSLVLPDVTDYPVTLEASGIISGNPAGTVLPVISIGDTGVYSRHFTTYVKQNEALMVQIVASGDQSVLNSTQQNYQVSDFATIAGVLENTTSRYLIANGLEKIVNTDSWPFPPSVDELNLGARVGPNEDEIDGTMSEARMSLVARSEWWLKATHFTLEGSLISSEETEDVPIEPDTYFNPDPTGATQGSNIYQNVRGGDVWFDVQTHVPQDTAWDILNEFLQNTSWDILNDRQRDIAWDILNTFTQAVAWDILNTFVKNTSWDILGTFTRDTTWAILSAYTKDASWDILNDSSQDTAWRIFSDILFFLKQIFIEAICFDYNIEEPLQFNRGIENPVEFTYYPTSVLNETLNMLPGVSMDTIVIAQPVQYTFQIKQPVEFNFVVSEVYGAGTDKVEKRN